MTHSFFRTVIITLMLSPGAFAAEPAQTGNAHDARQAIVLDSEERAVVLTEMRIFLQSVQQVTEGISNDDMDRVAIAARQSGRNAQGAMPASLPGKLPVAFKKLGFDTHAKFDALALDAEQLGDGGHALEQLGQLLNNCIACHAAFRFEVSAGEHPDAAR